MCDADPISDFVSNTTGSARDAVTNTTNSVIDIHHDTIGSALDMAKNTYNSGMSVMQPVLNPLTSAADSVVGAMGLPKDTFKNLNTSANDAVNNTLNAGEEANDTAAKAAHGLSKLQDLAMKKAQKSATSGVNRALTDPAGLLKDASDAAIGVSLAPVKPVIDAGDRALGGDGKGVENLVGKDASEATTNTMRAGISGVKAAEGVLLAAPTGGLSLTMTGDELSKAAGGSGNVMRDMGANEAFSMAARIASGVATGMAAPGQMVDPTTGAATLADPLAQSMASGAAQNVAMTAAMGGNEDQLGKAVATGAAMGAIKGGIGDDPLGNGNVTAADRAANAAVRQGTARGGMAVMQGQGLKEAGKQTLYGAAEGGGGQLITEAGRAVGNTNIITQTARGAWEGGVNAEANSNAFAQGARIGMAGGLAGSVAGGAAAEAGAGATVQAGVNKIGTEIGRGLQSLKEQRDYVPPLPDIPGAKTQTPDTSSRGKLGGLLQSGEFDRAGYVSPAIMAARAALAAKYNTKGA